MKFGQTSEIRRFMLMTLALKVLVFGGPATAALLEVGPNALLKAPSAAAALAVDGDRVTIAPGEYLDCAIWRANNLTITGSESGVVLSDKACEGKAIFVVRGRGVTISNLTFTRVRVADNNGAGVRLEGGDLTVTRSFFVNNQVGILAGDVAGSLKIIDCTFDRNGRTDGGDKTADVLVGRMDLLMVADTEFRNGRGGAAITSHAIRTELQGDRFFASDAPRFNLVGVPDGGSLAMAENVVTLNAASRFPIVAVARDFGRSGSVSIRRTTVLHPSGQPALLLRDWAGADLLMTDNVLSTGDTEWSRDGATSYLLKLWVHRFLSRLHSLFQEARHIAGVIARRLGIA